MVHMCPLTNINSDLRYILRAWQSVLSTAVAATPSPPSTSNPPAIHVPPAHIFLSFFQLDIWEGLNCELSRRGVAAGIGLHLYVEDGTGRDGQGTPAGGPVRHPAPPLQAVESRLQS